MAEMSVGETGARPSSRVPGQLSEMTFEAFIVAWEGTAVTDLTADATPVRDRVEALCSAGAHVFVVSGADATTVDRQLLARPGGPGRLHLCTSSGSEVVEVTATGPVPVWRRAEAIGPRPTGEVIHMATARPDHADSVRWAAAWLARRGLTGGLILVVGHERGPVTGLLGRDAPFAPGVDRAVLASVVPGPGPVPEGVLHLDGGPAALVDVFDAQLERRAGRRVPSIDEDPAWVVPLPTDPVKERVAEALGALSNGWAGTRGDGGSGRAPLFVVSGVYTTGPNPRLLPGPLWTGLQAQGGSGGERRAVDLRTGVLVGGDDGIGSRSLRLVSCADPFALGARAEAPAAHLEGGERLADPGAGAAFERQDRDGAQVARTSDGGGDAIVVAARDRQQTRRGRRTVERLAAWSAGGAASADEALERLAALEDVGFDRLLADHREAWAGRWQEAAVAIEGGPDDQLAARFALFHLLSAAPDRGEAAVGARGLTGTAYGGHVFWDSDVYVLPSLAATRPAAARAMLEYRVRRLPAARAAAAAEGRRGARFPWESATDGFDVTPSHVQGLRGELIPVTTGHHEIHIVADVAWAACEYAAWTGDTAFLTGPGRDLLLDTARYWHSRVRTDADGTAHLDRVMGPDEYHEVVDDNAFTNVMARWNLRRAADLVDLTGGDAAEAASWRAVADALVDGYDPGRGGYEQFAGYSDLEPLFVADVAPPPVAADLLLGSERVGGSQLIKQADVVMLHHMVPDDVIAGSLTADLAYYEPRTSHGSSLSPAIHAAQLARAGQPDRALELFRMAARIDLDDLTGTTPGGLHLATIGGVWQALAYGFLGLRPRQDGLDVDPCLPGAWASLSLRARFHGGLIDVRAEHDTVTVSCRKPLRVRIGGGPAHRCDPPGRTFTIGRNI